jgi:hypothetical protein
MVQVSKDKNVILPLLRPKIFRWATIAMKGKVVLNKDFGAGYKYDIILENGSL